MRNKKFGKLIALNPIQRRNKNKNVIWYCKCDCGNYTEVESLNLRTGHTTSCGICQKSKGEQKIKNILDSANIRYFHEYTFEDCINPKTGRKLRFDFYLPDYNCCIEYNGKQHYSKEGTWYKDKENDFYECLERDVIKKEYCRMNSLQLVRISFLEYNKITLDYLLNKILIDKK